MFCLNGKTVWIQGEILQAGDLAGSHEGRARSGLQAFWLRLPIVHEGTNGNVEQAFCFLVELLGKLKAFKRSKANTNGAWASLTRYVRCSWEMTLEKLKNVWTFNHRGYRKG